MDRAGIAEGVRRAMESEGPAGVVSLYLFGSHAEGRSHRESDVDLGILLRRSLYPTPGARFDARLELTARLAPALKGRPADLVILNDSPPLLARRIVTMGRRLFCADEATDRAFVREAQLRAADLEPFLRRMRGIKLKALRRP